MKKLQRIDDLTKALGYLKTITEKYNADFVTYVSCHGACNDISISIHVGGWGNEDCVQINLELNGELVSNNKKVLKELLDYSENGFDNNDRVKEAKNKQLSEKKRLFEKLKKELS